MIILGNSTILGGVAGTASAVVCTVYGTSTISFVETLKELSQGYLTVSVGTIYTTGSSEVQAIRSISLVNISSSPVTGVQLFVGGTGTVNTASPLITLPANGSALYEGTGWTVYDSTGKAQIAYSSTANQISNAMIQQSPAFSIKGNATSSTANVQDLTSYPQIPESFTTTATATGTTILTASSNTCQWFTGSAIQTVQMPATSTLLNGAGWLIGNSSTGLITIVSSGSNTIIVLPPNSATWVIYSGTSGTTAASWSVEFQPFTGTTTTVTSVGTTTLTAASTPYQIFTGSAIQIVVLPVTSTLILGQTFTVFNQSSGAVTVQSSGGNQIQALPNGVNSIFTCVSLTGTTAASWSVTFQPFPGTTTTATAAGTTTLTAASTPYQIFTGSTTQIVVLPVTSTLILGQTFTVFNQSSGGAITVQSSGGNQIQVLPNGVESIFTCVLLTGTTAASWSASAGYCSSTLNVSQGTLINDGSGSLTYGKLPTISNQIDIYGHSYFDLFVNSYGLGNTSPFILPTQSAFASKILQGMIGGGPNNVVNHCVVGSNLSYTGRSSGGFARPLTEIQKSNKVSPFAKEGGTLLLCYGINDVGNTASGSQATMRTAFSNSLIAIISRWRASAIYPATGALQWSFGSNYSNAPAANTAWNSGQSKINTTAGSTNGIATFTIPLGYQGEPITFLLVGYSSTSTCTVTWGGTVAGTTGITTLTTVLNSTGIDTHCPIPVRFTAAANGLSAANAGQTITMYPSTLSGGTLEICDAWIESLKPPPVIVCNCPRLPCRQITMAFGDGVTTGVNTSFTSATAAFQNANSSTTDVGIAITETDAQGGFGAGLTVGSVTNATTIALSGNALAAKTNIQFTIARKVNGYAYNYSTNTDFTGATVASHSAADTDVTTLNSTIATAVATFGQMVQIANLDSSIGADNNLPSGIATWYSNVDGLHPNQLGVGRVLQAIYKAMQSLQPETATDFISLGPIDYLSGATQQAGYVRRVICSGQVYTAENSGTAGATYSAVAGDVFAIPIFVTEPTIQFNNVLIQQNATAPTTGSSIRVGIYDDLGPRGPTGYPQCLRYEWTSGGAFAIGTSTGMRTVVTYNISPNLGLYWLVLKMDTIVTTVPVFVTIAGPNPFMPNATAASGSLANIGWKLTGVAAAVLPNVFPTGAALVTTAPFFGMQATIL